jgi:K+-transporting ATPase ATPase C chain
MFKEALNQMKTAILMLVFFTFLTGFIYPLIVTGVAQLFFPWKANGSLIQEKGQRIGSRLIGQPFSGANYFWSRPSATTPYPYNGIASSGSNSGPSNPDFLALIKERINQLKQANPQNNQAIPIDLVTASGSGLDPEISPFAAYYQAARIAKARHLPEETIIDLIKKHSKHRSLWILGEPRVNVLELNLDLDHLETNHG